MAIGIVDFPIKNGGFVHSFLDSLPEGIIPNHPEIPPPNCAEQLLFQGVKTKEPLPDCFGLGDRYGWFRCDMIQQSIAYPLVNCPITMENHHFEWENSL